MYPGTIKKQPGINWNDTADNIRENWFGANNQFVSNVQDRDDIGGLGVRTGQPRAVQTIRIPVVPVTLWFHGNGSSVPITQFLRPGVTNVTAVYMGKAHVTGIGGAPANVCLCFSGRTSAPNNPMQFTSSRFPGIETAIGENVVCEVGVAPIPATETLVGNCGQPQLVARYKQPRTFEEITLQIKTLDGTPVTYTDAVIWFYFESERWQ